MKKLVIVGLLAMSCQTGAMIRKITGLFKTTSMSEKVTKLVKAAEEGNLNLVRSLLAAGNIDVNQEAENSCYSALEMAAFNGHLEIVQELIRAGANVNRNREFRGDTALVMAIRGCRLDVFRELIRRGADVNLGNQLNHPLYVAIQSHRLTLLFPHQSARLTNRRADLFEMIQELIRAGARVDEDPSLHVAAESGDLDAVRALIRAGALINKKEDYNLDHFWETALHFAAKSGHVAIVRELLQAGANFNIRNNAGRTPAAEARANGHPAIERMIQEYPTLPQRLFVAGVESRIGNESPVQLLAGFPFIVQAIGRWSASKEAQLL